MTFFMTFAAFIVTRWNAINFQLMVIKKVFKIKMKEKLKKPGFCLKVRLMLGFFPDQYNKRLIERGT